MKMLGLTAVYCPGTNSKALEGIGKCVVGGGNEKKMYLTLFRSRVSSGSMVSDYGLGDRGSIPGRGNGFLLYPLCPDRLWGPTQPPVQWVPGVLSPGVKRGRGVTLTTHPHLVPKS
jgi:hypothetical protein